MTTHHHHHNASQASTPVQTPQADCCGHTQCGKPTHDQIASRAYDIYVKTGRKQGHCTQNWQQAEQSLHDQSQAKSAAL